MLLYKLERLMDEQTTHGEDDLGLSIQADEAADTSVADTSEQVNSEDEQTPDTLNLEEPVKEDKGKAEAARDKQAEAWAKKIMSMDKTIDDLPANLQWLKPFVEAKLGANAPDVKQTVAQVIAEERQRESFEKLKSQLQDAGLPNEKKVKLEEKFKLFRSKGLSQLDALETAKEALGIDLGEEVIERKRQAMRLRTPGTYAKTADPAALHAESGYAALAENLPPDKRLEYLKSLKK